ncbi:MAG: thermonuclease family protein [Polyangiaceae bacterium]|nr:thermonuclease family protein [Polyangiaceae bacterium]
MVATVACALSGGVAEAQTAATGTVTSVVDGDTLHVAVAPDGHDVTVRIIGIDTPETRAPGTPIECGGPDATDAMVELAQGKAVSLVTDPTQATVDRYGRSLFYVDRTDGLDVGLEMIKRGWSTAYVYSDPFQRLPTYEAAEAEADAGQRGVWGDCNGDFHRTARDERLERATAAKAFVRTYYRRVSNKQFLAAWAMLGANRKAQLRPYRRWKAAYRGSLSTSVLAAKARLSGGRAVVSVRLRARDRDVCSKRVVRQYFRGTVTVAPKRDSWVIVKFKIRKTSGEAPRTAKSRCKPKPPPPPPPPPPPTTNCQGYNPCITPGADVDCAGGSGNGPRYVEGPVYVNGSDPYDLDSDGDSVACES